MSIITAATSSTCDGHGNPMTGGAASIELYDRAVDRLVRFHPDVIDLAAELVEVEQPAPMAHALTAYLHLLSTAHADLATAADALDALASTGANEREQLHTHAIGAWVAGDWVGAARWLDEVLQRWPTDVRGRFVRRWSHCRPRSTAALVLRGPHSRRERPSADDPDRNGEVTLGEYAPAAARRARPPPRTRA